MNDASSVGLCATRRTFGDAELELFGAPSDSIARYTLLGKLGSGSMGTVYRAHDVRLDREVAVKILHPSGERTAQLVSSGDARLLREAQAIARLSHPNIVAIHDVGIVGDRVFFAMEYVEGRTLRAHCDDGARGWRELLPCFIQAGRGLAAAHERGVIHRDVKPDNILVGADGRVRVLDFSVARPGPTLSRTDLSLVRRLSLTDTKTNVMVGTPAYMAPEQLRAEPADERSDQFGFCVTMYECLLGERPFLGPTLNGLIDSVLAGPPRHPPPYAPQIPKSLFRCIARGLALDPDARWPDIRSLVVELERLLARPRRRSSVALAASLGAAAALAAGAVTLRMSGSACPHPALAARLSAR